MFGLDKLFGGGGLLGKFFDSVGLGWMTNVMSLAANVMTGNWLAAAQDVFKLVSQFSNDSWMKRVSQSQPLGAFDTTGGCFGSDGFSLSRLEDLRGQASRGEARTMERYSTALRTVHETVGNSTTANQNLWHAQMNQPA